jgi:hypothetical protein
MGVARQNFIRVESRAIPRRGRGSRDKTSRGVSADGTILGANKSGGSPKQARNRGGCVVWMQS